MSSRSDRRRRARQKVLAIKLEISGKVVELFEEFDSFDKVINATNKWCNEQASKAPQERDIWRQAAREWVAEFDERVNQKDEVSQ